MVIIKKEERRRGKGKGRSEGRGREGRVGSRQEGGLAGERPFETHEQKSWRRALAESTGGRKKYEEGSRMEEPRPDCRC